MSTILKALKKSEAERQLGEPPRLNRLPPAQRLAGKKQSQQAWIVAALGCVAAGLVAYLLWPDLDPADWQLTSPAAQRVTSAMLAEPQTQDTPDQQPAVSPDTPRSVPPAKEVPEEQVTSPAPAPETPVADEPTPESATPAGEERIASEPAPETAAPDKTQTPAPVFKEPEPAATPEEEELPQYALLTRYRHLPRERREALPPLTLNVLIYAEDPARRFVMINLNRYTAGDAIVDGLKVVEIAPAGVVLEGSEGRFLLPRP